MMTRAWGPAVSRLFYWALDVFGYQKRIGERAGIAGAWVAAADLGEGGGVGGRGNSHKRELRA